MQKLITYINSLTGFSPESWQTLQPALTRRTYERGELLLQAGEVCNSLFFIEEGFVRTFHATEGAEISDALHFDEKVVTNIRSFSADEVSAYSIEACESVTAIIVDKLKLQEAGRVAPQIAILGKNCLSFVAARLEEYADLFHLYTPSERYDYMLKNKPHIVQRVPPHILAPYLGIGREKLNSIRKRQSSYSF